MIPRMSMSSTRPVIREIRVWPPQAIRRHGRGDVADAVAIIGALLLQMR